jgi:hypothetical protein
MIVCVLLLFQGITENYANPKTCFFHVLFKVTGLKFLILYSAELFLGFG